MGRVGFSHRAVAVRQPTDEKDQRMSRGKWIAGVVVVLVAAAVGYKSLGTGKSAPDAMRGGPGDQPIPVTAVPAAAQDVPVFLTALGTVQALNTVTISAQVSGRGSLWYSDPVGHFGIPLGSFGMPPW